MWSRSFSTLFTKENKVCSYSKTSHSGHLSIVDTPWSDGTIFSGIESLQSGHNSILITFGMFEMVLTIKNFFSILTIVDFSIFQEQKCMRGEVTMSTGRLSYSLTPFKSLAACRGQLRTSTGSHLCLQSVGYL